VRFHAWIPPFRIAAFPRLDPPVQDRRLRVAEDVQREEEPRGVEAARVIVDDHLRLGSNAQASQELRAFLHVRQTESPRRHPDPGVVDVKIDRPGNVPLPIVSGFGDHVHDPDLRLGQPHLEPGGVNEEPPLLSEPGRRPDQ